MICVNDVKMLQTAAQTLIRGAHTIAYDVAAVAEWLNLFCN